MIDIFQPALQSVLRLLSVCELPTADLTEDHVANFLACGELDRLIGVAGLELYPSFGLVRSIGVSPEARNLGCGKRLLTGIEQIGAEHGLQCLYLLTTTAAEYFEIAGYRETSRLEVPWAIQQTAEFSRICPADAVVMKKDMNAAIS